MIVIYFLLFTVLYAVHCLMARQFVSHYTARPPLAFHWNLFRWNKDVQYLLDY